ncbi:hypothetical protein [Acanthopleuribacter pedis]|uniref:Uncharacterized protein n=1 Tax=Acanthopleuribacter pedis TaxID=442870 RepID=A0A8J7Q201_9BACT|nr:hypothetical protein [Acanthopleuribacter pedis]MBO1317805.1 hypothetical protein [Acanthopleuribacter pedis]
MSKVEELISQLDGSDEEWDAIKWLRENVSNELPIHLLKAYPKTTQWKKRESLVYHSMRYARESQPAKDLGMLALKDRSKMVRYRACMLLAYSLDQSLLPNLLELKKDFPENTMEDLLATIDAIQSQNHHYFVDRDHSGKIKLNIG